MPTIRLNPDVTIAPLKLEHAPEMLGFVSDPHVARNIGLRTRPSLEKTVTFIGNAVQDPAMRAFAILLSKKYVGNVTLDRIDRHLESARLSIYVGAASARGSGAGPTATYLVLKEAFTTLKLKKVWLTVHAENAVAIRTYLQTGFALEGIHREEFILDGRRIAALYMGLLACDFERIELAK